MDQSQNYLQSLQQVSGQINSLHSKNKFTWCSGCGNFGIVTALKQAIALENIGQQELFLCYDVGCNGNESDKIEAFTAHGLHGRVLPLAAGVQLANTNLKVIAQAGDGATFSEGVNHLIHAIRNNYNLTFICHNNSNYGLTIGQASSTTKIGAKMEGTPGHVYSAPLNTLQLVLSSKPTFVARGFSGDIEHMTKLIQAGMNHQGFSYIEVLQVCPTFNKETPQSWYWDKIYYLENGQHDQTNLARAWEIAGDEERLALGIFYQDSNSVPAEKQISWRLQTATELNQEVQNYSVVELTKSYN